MNTSSPDLPPRGPGFDLLSGLWLLPRAAVLIARTPDLRRWSGIAALVTAVALAGVAVLAWRLAESWTRAWADAGWAQTGLAVLLWPLLFSAGALTVPNLLLAPLADPLSEGTSRACGRPVPPPLPWLGGTLLALRHTLTRLALVSVGTAALLLLYLVPGVGGALWVTLSTLWSAFWLVVEHLSTPMARRDALPGEVVQTLRRRPGLALGLGLALTGLLWVPVVNFFLLPVAVVAGTLLFEGLSAGKGGAAPSVTLSPPPQKPLGSALL
jgi:CysZ protein